MNYTENEYEQNPRIIDEEYRLRLQSFQVPAIRQHFGSLEKKVFADIGCGDIPLAYCQDQIGRPSIYYATDLSEKALNSGVERLQEKGVNIDNIKTISGAYFDFSLIPDDTIEYAFSNSLFSHLSINTILICLKNLRPKMRNNAKYLSSMIILPEGLDVLEYEWKVKHGSISHSAKDPFHYNFNEFKKIVEVSTDFECSSLYKYGHPFQVLIEFSTKKSSKKFIFWKRSS